MLRSLARINQHNPNVIHIAQGWAGCHEIAKLGEEIIKSVEGQRGVRVKVNCGSAAWCHGVNKRCGIASAPFNTIGVAGKRAGLLRSH